MKNPQEESKEILSKFYAEIGFRHQATRCALIAVKMIIESLEKNRNYTQCTIDLEYYKKVKAELESSL